jgi:hypothetical protein
MNPEGDPDFQHPPGDHPAEELHPSPDIVGPAGIYEFLLQGLGEEGIFPFQDCGHIIGVEIRTGDQAHLPPEAVKAENPWEAAAREEDVKYPATLQ